MNKEEIKIGQTYKIKYPGEKGIGWRTEPYEGIGKCEGEEGYGMFHFTKLKPKMGEYDNAIFADIDIVKEVKKVKKKII